MDNNFPFKILSEEQMQRVQQLAHDKFLLSKEEDAWKRYCSSENVTQPGRETIKRILVPPMDSADEFKTLTATQQPNVGKEPLTRPNPVSKAKNDVPITNDSVLKELDYIKKKLNSFEVFSTRLKKPKNRKEAIMDASYENVIPKNKIFDPLKQKTLLRQLLETSLANLKASKNKPVSDVCPNPSGLPVFKNIGFQMPYVLKEQENLARRQHSMMSQKKSMPKKQPSIVNHGLKTQKTGRFLQNVSCARGHTAKNDTRTNAETDKLVEEVVEELFKESISEFKKAEASKKKMIEEQIAQLTKQITEIEKVEEQVRNKWKSQCASSLNVTYTKPLSSLKTYPSSTSSSVNKKQTYICENALLLQAKNRTENEPTLTQPYEENESLDISDARILLPMHANAVRNIQKCKEKFEHYISIKYPCFSINVLCAVGEAILDDCIHSIATELQNIPQSIVQDLYNHEFVL